VFGRISSEFRGISRVFVNFAGFRGYTWISRLRDSVKFQKPWIIQSRIVLCCQSLWKLILSVPYHSTVNKMATSIKWPQSPSCCPLHYFFKVSLPLSTSNQELSPFSYPENPRNRECKSSLWYHTCMHIITVVTWHWWILMPLWKSCLNDNFPIPHTIRHLKSNLM